MRITNQLSNEQITAEIGKRIQSARIDLPMSQKELAERAGISLRTVANIESGKDVQLRSFLQVMRTLGLIDRIDTILDEEQLRPSDAVNLGKRRQRATAAKYRQNENVIWQWGDEEA